MEFRVDVIADLRPGKTNWIIQAKVLNSWYVTEFFQKRVLLLADTRGDTIEVAFLPGTYKKMRKYIYDGDWYEIRNFKVIQPTLRERNTHHPFQIKFTDESTMGLLSPVNQRHYFRFEDLGDISRGRITHPISFVGVEDRRLLEGANAANEVVLTLLNGRNETLKCRALDDYAARFINAWEALGCHLTFTSEPVFCILRFWKVGSYEGAPCLVNTTASSQIYIKPDFEGMEHHKAISEFVGRYYIEHIMEHVGENAVP
ncbi:PREDICTED: uncharacterized protein LOC109131579 [Camelina sativa]|uniref:Uncharacterized protein LOC109131579 n=1 Tax=Camelina sativa TaxID=90675 RepID=A0ABM1RGV9_CAMSA|nr:PREDICTED: uncharacterized protein LOC109131579 [Camelina sativa]